MIISRKTHTRALELFIADFETDQSQMEQINQYRIEDRRTKRHWWVSNGPAWFGIFYTSKGEYVDTMYSPWWRFNKIHRKAWNYAKIIMQKRQDEIDDVEL